MPSAPEIRIRTVDIGDLRHLLHHRRSMYEAMGHSDGPMLDEVLRVSEMYFRRALVNGRYRGWLAEAEGRVVGGAGVVINDWPAHPHERMPLRAWILNM